MTKGKSLPARSLGSSGISVSAIGLGCMSLSGTYGTSKDDEGIALIREALDQGITFLDTSDAYGKGHNEELVGKAIAGRRNELVLATKFGNVGGGGGKVADGRPEYVASSCEASLKRLGVDTIDLYYQHRVDPDVPIEETIGAMARLIEQGKVRYLGMSEAGAKTIRRAHAVYPITALQSEYSLWTREPEDEILGLCKELGIGFVPFSPLGRGMLTGQVKSTKEFGPSDFRLTSPRFQGENFDKNLEMVHQIEQM